MYLSQPRDLNFPMSAGCSRATMHLPLADKLAPLQVSKPEDSSKDRAAHSPMRFPPLSSEREMSRSREPSGTINQQLSERPYSRPMTFLHVGNDPLTRVLSGSDSRSMSRLFRSQHFQAVWERLDSGSSETRPPHPYTELIKLCILKRREGKLTLNQLYRDLEEKFPFFATSHNGKGWRNTLRHNLSTQPYFIKLDRERGQLGKGHYWAYCPDLEKPTSLAQSSVVQLSSLWPPSISASSIVPRPESARELCSASEPSNDPKIAASVTTLPRFEDLASRRSLDDLLRNRYASFSRSARNEQTAFAPPVSMRRLSSPAFHHIEEPVATSRVRSATISTFSLSAPASSTKFHPLDADRKSSVRLSPAKRFGSFTSTMSSVSDAARDIGSSGSNTSSNSEELVSRLPPLSDLPPMSAPARKSLGDYYLSNPISRR